MKHAAGLTRNNRPVPKRPCAISLSFDDNTIFSADKGGDVYGLSFHPSEDGELRIVSRPKKAYHPAANAQVVHTKRNLYSLQQQIRQQQEREKQGIEHTDSRPVKPDALLGHISILTDIALGAVPSTSSTDKSHVYLLTADRDEQIRVSRGPPQTHIIEAYCLGHELFVTRLCTLTSAPHLLISGGGDDYLLVWDWRIGQPLHKVHIAPEGQQGKIVVRGIWEIRFNSSSSVAIIVAFNGYANPHYIDKSLYANLIKMQIARAQEFLATRRRPTNTPKIHPGIWKCFGRHMG
jgi:tRNA (guanine-N(7)-)-methyltransferase subunit TRM82